MSRTLLVLASLSLLTLPTAAFTTSAVVTLPLRLDLVANTTAPSSSLPADGTWTSMAYNAVYSYPSRPYGWSSAASGNYDSTAFSVGYGGYNQSDLVLAKIGSSDPFYDEQKALARDGHSITDSTVANRRRIFRAAVSPSVSNVLVRVLVGRAADTTLVTGPPTTLTVTKYMAHGIQIHAGAITSSTDPTGQVTLDEYPAMVSNDYEGTTGIWSRTLLRRAALEPAATLTTVPEEVQEASFSNVWFKMAADTSPTDYSLVEFTVDVDSGVSGSDAPYVGAVEIYDYEAPPASFDLTYGIVVNSGFDWPSVDDEDDFTDGINELRQGRVTTALGFFDEIEDDSLQGAAYLWAVGWLGVSNDPLMASDPNEWDLLELAIDRFESDTTHSVATSAPSWVQEYRFRAREFERALLHQRFRAFTSIKMPNEVGGTAYANPLPNKPLGVDTIVANLGIAEALWRDIGAQLPSAGVGNSHLDLNPLFFKACTYLGINYWQRHTQWKDIEIDDSQAWFIEKAGFAIWKDLDDLGWFAGADGVYTGPFWNSDVLAMAHHMALADLDTPSGPDYDEESDGGIVKLYGGEAASAVYGTPDANWWDMLMIDATSVGECTVGTALPAWAAAGGRYLLALRAVHDWWLHTGSSGSEFGGGDTDDVEFILQQAKALLPLRGSQPELASLAQSVADAILLEDEATNFFEGDGSATVAADVEHTAEGTGDSAWAMEQLFRGDPYYLEYAMQSLALMDTVPSPGTAWTATMSGISGAPTHSYPLDEGAHTPATITLRRFLAFHFDGEGISSTSTYAGDVPLNARAVQPAFVLANYNGHALVKEKLRQWTEFWWLAAQDTDDLTNFTGTTPLKMPGVLPGVVNFDGTYMHYGLPATSTTAGWWTGDDADYNFLGQLKYMDMIYGLFFDRFRDPDSDTASTGVDEGLNYLLPIYTVAKMMAEAYRENQSLDPGTYPEIYHWTHIGGDDLDGAPRWTANKLLGAPGILHQVALALPYFPEFASSTKCGSLVTPDGGTLNAEVIDVITLLIASRTELAGDTAVIEHDASGLELPLTSAFNWLSGFFPLMTEWVGWTDRIFIDSSTSGAQVSFQAATGGDLTGTPNLRFTWEPFPDASEADAAPIVITPAVLGEPSAGLTRILFQNFEQDGFADSSSTRQVTLRLWTRTEKGAYELRLDANDGSDAINLSGYSGPVLDFDVTRFGGKVTFDLPYATDDCGDAWVLELTRTGNLGSGDDITGFWDAAVTLHDYAVNFDGTHITFEAPVHNIGIDGTPNTLFAGIYLELATNPDGPWTAWVQSGSGLPFVFPSAYKQVPGQTDLAPKVRSFSFSTINWTPTTTDYWLRTTYIIGTYPVETDFNPLNDSVQRVTALPGT